MNESVVPFGIEHEQALIQQNVDRNLARAVDHEFGSRLAQDRGRLIDELPGLSLDTQIDAALGIGSRRPLRDRHGVGSF